MRNFLILFGIVVLFSCCSGNRNIDTARKAALETNPQGTASFKSELAKINDIAANSLVKNNLPFGENKEAVKKNIEKSISTLWDNLSDNLRSQAVVFSDKAVSSLPEEHIGGLLIKVSMPDLFEMYKGRILGSLHECQQRINTEMQLSSSEQEFLSDASAITKRCEMRTNKMYDEFIFITNEFIRQNTALFHESLKFYGKGPQAEMLANNLFFAEYFDQIKQLTFLAASQENWPAENKERFQQILKDYTNAVNKLIQAGIDAESLQLERQTAWAYPEGEASFKKEVSEIKNIEKLPWSKEKEKAIDALGKKLEKNIKTQESVFTEKALASLPPKFGKYETSAVLSAFMPDFFEAYSGRIKRDFTYFYKEKDYWEAPRHGAIINRGGYLNDLYDSFMTISYQANKYLMSFYNEVVKNSKSPDNPALNEAVADYVLFMKQKYLPHISVTLTSKWREFSHEDIQKELDAKIVHYKQEVERSNSRRK